MFSHLMKISTSLLYQFYFLKLRLGWLYYVTKSQNIGFLTPLLHYSLAMLRPSSSCPFQLEQGGRREGGGYRTLHNEQNTKYRVYTFIYGYFLSTQHCTELHRTKSNLHDTIYTNYFIVNAALLEEVAIPHTQPI